MIKLTPNTDNYYKFHANEGSPEVGQFALVDQGRLNELRIVAFSIYGAHRGNGYGQQMMQEAIELANRIKGDRTITLNVLRNNRRALHIYEKHGFKIVDEYGDDAWKMVYIDTTK